MIDTGVVEYAGLGLVCIPRGEPVDEVVSRADEKGGLFVDLADKPVWFRSRFLEDETPVAGAEKEEGGRRKTDRLGDEFVFDIDKQPKPDRGAYRHAMEISVEHGELAALYLLLYTAMCGGKTKHLLPWSHGWFVVPQVKAKRRWHFYPWLIHRVLDNLGLEEGIYYNPWSREHEEARRIAKFNKRYIVEYYGSHRNARRLATHLVENGMLWTEERVDFVVRLHYYEHRGTSVEICDYKGEELYTE